MSPPPASDPLFLRHAAFGAALALGTLVSGCGREEPRQEAGQAAPASSTGDYATFAGIGRDRLCLSGPNADAAVLVFGEGDRNCLVRGRLEGGVLVPNGDTACRIPVTRQSDSQVVIGTPPPSCAYYCGPGASLAGKTFNRTAKPEPLSDIGGDALC